MKVSVIIPAHNSSATIKRLIDEIELQLKESYEIIVIDDGSIDGTSLHVVGHNVRCITQSNQGPASARNNGAYLAHGEILIFLDSDLLPGDGFFNIILRTFACNDIAAVQGAMRTTQKKLIPLYCQGEIDFKQLKCRQLRFIDSIAAGIFAITRIAFTENVGFCELFRMAAAEDTDFSFRMCKNNYKILFVPEAFVYHDQPDSIHKYCRLKFWRGYWRSLLYFRHPDKILKDSYTANCQKAQVMLLLMLPSIILLSAILSAWHSLAIFGSLFAISLLPSAIGILRICGARVAIISPFMQLSAAGSLSLGILFGFIKEVLFTKYSCANHGHESKDDAAPPLATND